MERKWTPGAWKAVKAYGHEPEHIYWDVRPKDSGWEGVASVWCSKDADSRITREAMDANAHLIAAAPELYEALESARAQVKKWCHYQGDSKALFDQYLGPIDAALTKARGE